jgi:hypothetical protein
MLGTGARYAEYGITGGFFLLTQALILGFAYPDMLVWSVDGFGALLSASVGKIPPLAESAIQSLLVALALLSVFIIGLVLEIIGSVFMLYEAVIFKRYLAMNQWIEKFVKAELPDYAEDYGAIASFSYWRHSPFSQRKVQKRFRRLENVLIAKVLASGAKTEMLADQLSICRMSRAIGTALWLIVLEVLPPVLHLGQRQPTLRSSWGEVLLSLITSLSIICAILITLGAYSRFANMLFSLVYASWKPAPPNSRESAGGGRLENIDERARGTHG